MKRRLLIRAGGNAQSLGSGDTTGISNCKRRKRLSSQPPPHILVEMQPPSPPHAFLGLRDQSEHQHSQKQVQIRHSLDILLVRRWGVPVSVPLPNADSFQKRKQALPLPPPDSLYPSHAVPRCMTAGSPPHQRCFQHFSVLCVFL